MGGVIKLNVTIMEQFNLEKYLANPSIKVVTRDGRRVRVICTDMKSTTYPVVALTENGSGYEQITTFSKNGEYAATESSRSDLFFATEKDKEQRFDPNTLHPFDKILARDSDKQSWTCEFFSHINNICKYSIIGLGLSYKWCIPYNEETKHLVGTTNDCPDYYKWWEE